MPEGSLVGLRRRLTNIGERLRRTPWPEAATPPGDRVAVVSVSYNSLEHTNHLLFSLFRVLEPGSLRDVIVVDNRSSDGSVSYLEALVRRGLIHLVRSTGPPYHGPGLNRGMEFLARRQRDPARRVDYVWIVDSDVIVLRPDALASALDAMRRADAALAGQFQNDQPDVLPEGYAHVSANLLDPRRVWRRGISPFLEHGAPGAAMQRSLRDAGATVLDFPFYSSEYLLHLGRGTLGAIAKREERRNRYYGWAVKLTTEPPEGDPEGHHFHGNPHGRQWLERFVERFREELPSPDPEEFASACSRPERVSL